MIVVGENLRFGQWRSHFVLICNYRPFLRDTGKKRNLRIADKCENSVDMPE